MITLEVNDTRESYMVLRTNAPKDYDYPYVIELYDGGDERHILVPTKHVDHQSGRNTSGLFQTHVDVECTKEYVESFIWNRIQGRNTR